ncbi:MAG: peptidoglycan bridge formation glycyltransferase FemA/FemB family protein [Candidatus Paceibacterota bacterium]|jgi:lipid II:glycine glycyltransferase (peptidoglycan interpeptide bridge formation enzyme)
MYSILETKDPNIYRPLNISDNSSFTQGLTYGSWQRKMGRNVRNGIIKKDNEIIGTFQIIFYPLFGKKTYGYIPHGPILKQEFDTDLALIFKSYLKDVCAEENATFLRFDKYPFTKDCEILDKSFTPSAHASYYGAFFQYPYDWVTDISGTIDQIFEKMHEKTYYAVQASQRRGAEVLCLSGAEMSEYFETFYELMEETSARGAFHLHPKSYYKDIFDSALNDKNILLFVAKYQGIVLATHLLIVHGKTIYYPYGASREIHRNILPTYAIHLAVIKEAKVRGCTGYNWGAIEHEDFPQKNWSGISSFKKRFGGDYFAYSPFYDHVSKPFWYWLYILRKKYRDRKNTNKTDSKIVEK